MKPGIAAVAGTTLLLAVMQAQPCYADVVSFPDPTGTGLGPVLGCAAVFVLLISGISFALIRREARRRAAAEAESAAWFAAGAGDNATPPAEAPEAPDER
jgi:hypothetical protein